MTKKDFAEIVFKVLGLYLFTIALDDFIEVVKSLSYFFAANPEDAGRHLFFLAANSFGTLFYLFGFWLMTFKTSIVINKLISDSTAETSFISIDKHALLQILFCTSGILILFYSITGFWNTLLTVEGLWKIKDLPDNYRHNIYLTQFCIAVTKGIFGLTLLLFSRRLARLLTKNKPSKI